MKNVGRRFRSPYFNNRIIVVSEYKNDKKWRFFFEDEPFKQFKAGTPLSHFEKEGLEIKE